jgi:nucleoside-diphosphate-sugar epimerase
VNGPLRENYDRILGSPVKWRWSYSTSKAVDEILAYSYWRDRGTPTVIVRLFNTVGSRETGTYGMVVPRFVRHALGGEPVTVFGDGEQRRSFSHVHDVVAAFLKLLDHPGAVDDVFNMGAKKRDHDSTARRADPGRDRIVLADRACPVRRGPRRGVRGHGAASTGHHQAGSSDRVAADEIARRHHREKPTHLPAETAGFEPARECYPPNRLIAG